MHRKLLILLVATVAVATVQSVSVPEGSARLIEIDGDIDIHFYKKMIKSQYSAENLVQLAATIEGLYEPKTSKNFNLMVRVQLHLYGQFLNKGDVNDKYLFNVAYYFYKMKTDKFYKTLAANVKSNLQKDIDTLPPSLINLFFKPSFCLLNRKYLEYLYIPNSMDMDDKRRYVFTWGEKEQGKAGGAWIAELTDNSKSKVNLKFSLKNKSTDMFLYLERNEDKWLNIIAAWRSGKAPKNSNWSVELVQNQLVFKQNGGIMCDSDQTYSKRRRYVVGYDDKNHTEQSAECQWYAKECP